MLRFPEELRSQSSGVLLQCINGLETFYAHMDEMSKAERNLIAFDNIGLLKRAEPYEYIGEVLWLLYGVYIAKYRELLNNLIRSTEYEEFLVFALCGRAIIETTATLRYYNKKIQTVISNAQNLDAFSQNELSQIIVLLDKHAKGGRFDWNDFWKLSYQDMAEKLVAARKNKNGKENQKMNNPQQVNILTTIDSWATDEQLVALAYEFFCELVHPNIGSNFVVMGVKNDSLQVGGETIKSVGRGLAIEGIQFLAPIIREASLNMGQLLGWAATTKPKGI